MSHVIGGSWHGVDQEGYPPHQRKLVLFRRTPEGDNDFSASETYVRDGVAGSWRFLHEGPATGGDGPWYFDRPGG